jgi:nitroreductase
MSANGTATETDFPLLEAINQRRSVRSYLPAVLDDVGIHALLRAAVRAPTAVHQEPWAFAILQDPTILRRLSDRAKASLVALAAHHTTDRGGHLPDAFLRPDFNIFHDAGTLIAICARPMSEFTVADCWLAAENLMLAAHAMGLGTCVIGSAVAALNAPEGKADLGIPADYAVVAPIVVGVPRDRGAATDRKAPNILAWTR